MAGVPKKMLMLKQIFSDIVLTWTTSSQAKFNIIVDLALGAALFITLAGGWKKVLKH